MLTMGMGDREEAILRIIDWDSLVVIAEARYRSELSCFLEQVPSPPIPPRCKFNGGSFQEDLFFTCTHNEVVVYTYNSGLKLAYTFSRPTFTDLHHVHCEKDRLLVVNTGLEIIEEVDMKGNLIHQYMMADDVCERYDLTQDYRRIASTKPHTSHPNWITHLGNQYLVTMLQTRTVVELETRKTMISGFPHKIHDGVLYNGCLYYTTTNGHIVEVDVDTLNINHVYSTYPLFGRVQPGWCRGLYPLGNFHFLVGYTRFRKTYSPGFKPNLWERTRVFAKDSLKRLLGRPAPSIDPRMDSHIAEIDIKSGRLIKDYVLGTPCMTIYGIYPLNDTWLDLL